MMFLQGDEQFPGMPPIIYLIFHMVITGCNEVVAKVMFLQASVIPLTGGCLPHCMLGYTPQEQTPPQDQVHPPGPGATPQQTPPGPGTPPKSRHPPKTRTHPPPRPRTPLKTRDTPQRRPMECILVFFFF